MDFSFTPEQERFRLEVREFILSLLPKDFNPVEEDDLDAEGYALARSIQKELAKKRWLCIGWPEEYGGGGKGVIEQAIFNEEMAYWRVPRVYTFGPNLVGPTLIVHGTEEQKRLHLPAIAAGDVIYWQAFSEPSAGSDLASLKTRADRDGDDFILNGQKVFIGNEKPVDYLYALVRTDQDAPKHKGLTLFVVDAKSRGITYLPLQPLAGARKNQIFFEDVRVPATHTVGEINRGWYVAMTSLGLERSGIGNSASYSRILQELNQYCNETYRDGRPLAADPNVRSKLVELSADLNVMRLMAWRNLWQQANGIRATYESSQQALLGKTFTPKFAAYTAEIIGPAALTPRGSKWSPLKGKIEHIQRYSLLTHGGGTPEIQKNIIAERGLGMPRGAAS